ncbi:MAG: purine-binding chemotaxis protein CheW [Rhizobiales bacterium]|nr:purine-binding chemotaxis protein CheW [Hyphomicrobiales bacterium]
MIGKRRITDYDDLSGTALAPEDADVQQFVSFTVGDQHYCVDIMAVREIKAWTGTTSLPNSQAFVRGVINLRGTIIPVIDLRMRFGQGLTEPTPSHVVVIVAIGEAQSGLLVDGVSDIVTVPRRDIAAIPDLEGEDRNPFFHGLVTGQDNLMAVIALDQLVSQRLGGHVSTSTAA